MLLAGLSASMSILWCDSRSERLFDATEFVLGIGISGESTLSLTLSFPLLTVGPPHIRNVRLYSIAR